MALKRSIGNLLALIGLFVSGQLPDSWFAEALRYLSLGYISVDFILRARAGYLRRRPHWSPESWRKYLIACSIPVAALLIMVGMMTALEWRLPMVGPPQSLVRGLWVAGTVVFMLTGACGLAVVIFWLGEGDASRQFALPRWLARNPR